MSNRWLPSPRKPWLLLGGAIVLAAALGCAQAPTEAGAPAARAAPESVGMSSARLERITATFEQEVAAKRLPGAVVMASRKGKLVYARAFGLRDPKASEPMQLDSVFRIYSMSKPFAAVGAMMLVEDGVLQLGDPVSKWLPAFKDVKVTSGRARCEASALASARDDRARSAASHRRPALWRADAKRRGQGRLDQGRAVQAGRDRLRCARPDPG